MASALHDQLNHICISLLALTASPMLESVMASVESARKIEIVKMYAKSIIKEPTWAKGLREHVDAVEDVNRVRNVAAHSVMRLESGRVVLRSPAAAKLLKAIDLDKKTVPPILLESLAKAIKNGEAALASCANLLDNLQARGCGARSTN
jgi:hypothetical protein